MCVYLVGADGKGLASMIVSDAAQGDKLQKLLDATVARLGVPEGKPLVKPVGQAPPPKGEEGGLVLHLVSRFDHRGSWGEFPSENWIVLGRADVGKLLPPDEATKTWEIDRATAIKILTHFYPQVETCDFDREVATDSPHRHRVEDARLNAKIFGTEGGTVTAWLTCKKLRMKHTFYPGRDDDNYVDATVLGYMEFDAKTRQVRKLRLITDSASYGKHKFSVAVASE